MHKVFVYLLLLMSFNILIAQNDAVSSSSPEDMVSKANELYNSGEYVQAFDTYDDLISQGYTSPELHLNAGNAAYKQGLVPEAIWNFERAAKLDPSNEDVQFNLELARKKLTDKPKSKASYGMKYWLASSIGGSSNYWSWISIYLVIILSVLIAVTAFISSRRWKNVSRISSSVLVLLVIVSATIAWTKQSVANSVTHVVLFEPSCEVKNEPSEMGSVAFVLHEGSKLEIVDQNELWFKVSFSKNQVGWVLKEMVKEI